MNFRLSIFLLLIPLMGISQNSLLTSLIETSQREIADTRIKSDVAKFITSQEVKRAKIDGQGEIKFLRALVNQAHRKFLKNYKAYSHFGELFENGNYDCLTGTAFLSVVLEGLEFHYRIIETNYHIFLLVHTNQGEILIETTDRFSGFKTRAEEINSCINQYKKNILSASSEKQFYYYHSNLFREVNGMQLSGLLYFNQAVVSFNQHDWTTCLEKLELARAIYDNERVEELTKLLIDSIVMSNLNETEKNNLIVKLKSHLKASPTLASR